MTFQNSSSAVPIASALALPLCCIKRHKTKTPGCRKLILFFLKKIVRQIWGRRPHTGLYSYYLKNKTENPSSPYPRALY
jgi:hypothetical protein